MMHSLPVFLRLQGKPVILIGSGEAADAKRRLLERAGATIVGEDAAAQLAIVVADDAAVVRLKARGVLINAVDRADLCDFTLPAIVDRDPVLVAVGTGGASAGLAAALRQRLEAIMPANLGVLAEALHAARDELRSRWPDASARRGAIAGLIDDALVSGDFDLHVAPAQAGGQLSSQPETVSQLASKLDPSAGSNVPRTFEAMSGGHGDLPDLRRGDMVRVTITSPDPDELTIRTARLLGQADRIYHGPDIAPAILDRARADAARLAGFPPDEPEPGLTLILERVDG